MQVLVADGLGEEGLARLRQAGEVIVRSGLAEADLAALLPGADALIIRSGTRVSSAALGGAPRLRVIARAGVGVDNIDVGAAMRRGRLLVSPPASSTLVAGAAPGALLAAPDHP